MCQCLGITQYDSSRFSCRTNVLRHNKPSLTLQARTSSAPFAKGRESTSPTGPRQFALLAEFLKLLFAGIAVGQKGGPAAEQLTEIALFDARAGEFREVLPGAGAGQQLIDLAAVGHHVGRGPFVDGDSERPGRQIAVERRPVAPHARGDRLRLGLLPNRRAKCFDAVHFRAGVLQHHVVDGQARLSAPRP